MRRLPRGSAGHAHQSHRQIGYRRQLRDYVFGYFHISAGLAASVAPLTNTLMSVAPLRKIAAKTLGITQRRPFPKFASKRAKIEPQSSQSTQRVIFLSDPFTRYIEPETEQAAFDTLSICGFDVHVLPILGAGASFLSKGFIDQARAHAARVLDFLNQIDPSSEATIVGIEPPEIYALKHDYLDLLPERAEEIQWRVDHAWLLDEFLVRSTEFKNLRVANMERLHSFGNAISERKVHFHPHCHQRAQGLAPDGLPNGTNATLELLRSCGYDVELMDTGCCGMAGTFGYEAEHYELSMKVGELKVFPQIRELGTRDKELKLVSSGAACRLQIRQGTGVGAVHPIVLVANQLQEWKSHGKR